jgi:hypothetical protein
VLAVRVGNPLPELPLLPERGARQEQQQHRRPPQHRAPQFTKGRLRVWLTLLVPTSVRVFVTFSRPERL